MSAVFEAHSPAETLALGAAIGRSLAAGLVIGLVGRLGAGKTLLVKGIAAGNGLSDTRDVTSPTFTLVQEYPGRFPIRHLDVYRLNGAADLLALGFEEMCASGGVVIVEWADRVRDVMPEDTMWVDVASTGPCGRTFTLRASGRRGYLCVSAVATAPQDGGQTEIGAAP